MVARLNPSFARTSCGRRMVLVTALAQSAADRMQVDASWLAMKCRVRITAWSAAAIQLSTAAGLPVLVPVAKYFSVHYVIAPKVRERLARLALLAFEPRFTAEIPMRVRK